MLLSFTAIAQTRTASVPGLWSNTATWGGQSVPTSANDVIINTGVTVTIGAAATCGSLTINGTGGITTVGNAAAVALTVAGTTGTVSGTGVITNGGSATTALTINFTGDWLFTGTFSGNRLTVSPNGTVDQNMGVGANLTCRVFTVNKTGGKFRPNTRTITISTTFTLTAGTLVVDATTWAGNYSLATVTPSAGFTVEYTNTNPTMLGGVTWQNLVFSGSGTAGASTTMTIQGNLTTTGGGTLSFGANAVTLSGTVATQSIAGFTTTGLVSMTKTGGIATFTGNVNGAGLTINGSGGTLNLGTGLNHTFTGVITLTAGTLNGGSSTLHENATSTTAWNGTGTVFSAGTGTVDFGGAAQTISATATTFNNLTMSGSGIKTIGGTVTVATDLTVGANTTLTVTGTGNIQINTGNLILNGLLDNSGTINIGL